MQMNYFCFQMENTKTVSVSIVLDKRRVKENGKYPVKLRIFTKSPRIQKLYSTKFEYSIKEFQSIWETLKPRIEYKEPRKKLVALEKAANDVIEEMKHFTFDQFEAVFFKNVKGDYSDVISTFKMVINDKKKIGAISTAEKYQLALNWIQSFLEEEKKDKEVLPFESVDLQFLNELKVYCKDGRQLAAATIGIYLRNLRAVYRIGIEKKSVNIDNYPFANNKFKIPTNDKVNNSLTIEEIKTLWTTEPQNENQAKAKDFWFFSYYAYGMNTKDICELKHNTVSSDSFEYIRAKTRTTKKEQTVLPVPITKSMREIIERNKNKDSEYLFGLLNNTDNHEQRHKRIKRFTAFVNKHFRQFALTTKINEELAKQIGTYHARHSFATIAVRKGVSVALISEILHNGNLATTQSYLNSFKNEDYSKLSNEMEL